MNQIITVPNTLTLLRIALSPFFMWFFLLGGQWLVLAAVVFTIAALTDFYDGFFARRMGAVSTIGILLDPIADKVLVMAAFLCFSYEGLLPWWFFIVILGRDVVITVIRWIWHEQKTIITPSYLGKCKTVAQIILIYVLFAYLILHQWLIRVGWCNILLDIIYVIMYIVALVTAYTGISYINKWGFFEGKQKK
jgi:CDP-diacylglycerol--glycerol-3-phosphate 3-phosphatidyltransferase